MLCQTCKTLQITPEDLIYKLAKHKHIQLKNNKIIHLLHFNEKNSSTRNTDTSASNNGIIVARQAFQSPTDSSLPASTIQISQPKSARLSANETSEKTTSDDASKLSRSERSGDVSIHIKSEPNSMSSANKNSQNESKPLESYDTFTKMLTDSKLSPTFRYGNDCLDGDKQFEFSVYYRKKIKLGASNQQQSNKTDNLLGKNLKISCLIKFFF